MTTSALNAHKFYKEVATNKLLWTIKDANGFPAPINTEGKRAQPFWSSKSRAELIIKSVAAYSSFETYELSLDVFLDRWVSGLTQDGILVGVNWSGTSATGYDIEPNQVALNILAQNNSNEQSNS